MKMSFSFSGSHCDEHDFIINSVAANIKSSPKYFTCGDNHEIWHTYLSDNTVSKIIIGHRDFRHFHDGCRQYLVQSLVIQKYTTKRPNNDNYDSK
jgi:hypothetical protein